MVKGNATGLGDLVLGAVGSAERLRPEFITKFKDDQYGFWGAGRSEKA